MRDRMTDAEVGLSLDEGWNYLARPVRGEDRPVAAPVAAPFPAPAPKPLKFVRLSKAQAVPRQRTRTRDRRVAIYVLVDPRDAGVRYVGKTRSTLTKRLLRHIEEPTNAMMAAWFRNLASLKLRPHIEALEFVSKAEWQDAERGWIHWFRKHGDLLNIDLGGNHRDGLGRPRGKFVGTYQEARSAAQARPSSLWDRVHRPMGTQGSHATRRYAEGDPG